MDDTTGPADAGWASTRAPLLTRLSCVAAAQLDEAVVAIDWSPAGRLAVLTADGRVIVDEPERASTSVGGATRDLCWVDDSLLAVVDHRLGVVLAGGGDPTTHPLGRARSVRANRRWVVAIGGTQVWSLGVDGRVGTVAARCGELHDVSTVPGPTGPGSMVAVVGTGGIAVVDLALGLVDVRVELEAPLAVAVDPTGELVAAGDLGGSIHVLRVGDEAVGRELTGYPDRVRLVAWADRGRWLLATADDELTCWPVVGAPGGAWPAAEPESCLGHEAMITALSATPNCDLAATGDASGGVAVWSLRSPHRPIARSETSGEVTAIAWSADGTRLAVGDVSGSLQVHAVARGQVA